MEVASRKKRVWSVCPSTGRRKRGGWVNSLEEKGAGTRECEFEP